METTVFITNGDMSFFEFASAELSIEQTENEYKEFSKEMFIKYLKFSAVYTELGSSYM